jgi:hypothetical protein
VRLVRHDADSLVLRFGGLEFAMLRTIVDRYPVVPPAHPRVRRNPAGRADEEKQRLLDEALAEHRAERREQVRALLTGKAHVRPTRTGIDLTLSPAEVEWLLQVLNDVRVGSWIALGEPEDLDRAPGSAGSKAAWMLMDGAGHFESGFLEVLRGEAGEAGEAP